MPLSGDFLPPSDHLAELSQALLSWFATHARPLPWRRDYTPYRVWISEVMLQQTQMDRGVAYFNRWMERFPDIATLASASEEAVLQAWEGLGYYTRARNIMKAAKFIAGPLKGVFPATEDAIRLLPGVGPYTAAAVASIAFQADTVCIDANVERVVSRLFDIDTPLTRDPGKSLVRSLAHSMLQKGTARAHNQAMMELGALVCGKGPDCPDCPIARFCTARARHTQDDRPIKERKDGMIPVFAASGVLLLRGKVFLQKRLPDDTWGGLWEFPGGTVEPGERPEETVVREFFEETGFKVEIAADLGVRHAVFTRHKLTLHCYLLRLAKESEPKLRICPSPPRLTAATEWRWAGTNELGQYAMPSAHRKLADNLAQSMARPRAAKLPGIL